MCCVCLMMAYCQIQISRIWTRRLYIFAMQTRKIRRAIWHSLQNLLFPFKIRALWKLFSNIFRKANAWRTLKYCGWAATHIIINDNRISFICTHISYTMSLSKLIGKSFESDNWISARAGAEHERVYRARVCGGQNQIYELGWAVGIRAYINVNL